MMLLCMLWRQSRVRTEGVAGGAVILPSSPMLIFRGAAQLFAYGTSGISEVHKQLGPSLTGDT